MILCRKRLVARSFPPLPPPGTRPAAGSGASVGPRRIVLPAIACVSLGAGVTAAVMHHVAETPPQEPSATRIVDASVPEPAALALFGFGAIALGVIRRISK